MNVFGIDFGTTNSATVGVIGKKPMNFGYGNRPFPSVVAINRLTGQVEARGHVAWQNRESLMATCEVISSPKSYLGTGHIWKIGDKNWLPVDIAAEVFKGLKDLVDPVAGEVTEAVVSIPVGFAPAKRRELRAAAHKAGLRISSFISEPTAALLKNREAVKRWTRIAVFDWGGGTLDISVVELMGDSVRELAAVGLKLGGDDLDRILAEWAHNTHIRAKSHNVAFHEVDKSSRDRLIARAEEAKRTLSNEPEADIMVPSYGGMGDLHVQVTVEKLQSLLNSELERVIDALKEAVNTRAKMSFDDLGCVLMVGGSSKLNGLYDRIVDLVSCEVIKPASDADWQVAQGAALLGLHQGSYINSDNIGIELCDGTFLPIITEGAEVEHVKYGFNFGIVEDTQSACFNFHKASTNTPLALESSHAWRIGTLIVPTNGFVNEVINLDYEIDPDLFLRVTAKSNHKGSNIRKDWEYDQLLFSYKLPPEVAR